MDRKWRFNRAGYDTVLSVPDFKERIPPCIEGENTLVTPTDLYAVYTLLHIERKEWELRWSVEASLYYYLVTWQDIVKEPAKPKDDQANGEGDEMMDDDVDNEEDAEYREYSAADSEGASEPEDDAATNTNDNGNNQNDGLGASTKAQQGEENEAGGAKPIQWYTRTQIVIPVSSSSSQLTPLLLQRFFKIRGVAAQQLILALIDANGVPTQNVLYNYIQSPLEGPGMADLDLVDS